ncbi:MAG TPA: tetratricopeptide repeat protein, partial [Thermoanaerobaculaceae bacterium]|nr:tetratricopeptide repeat protein [Thermoanaerobaculaceae bacterium]
RAGTRFFSAGVGLGAGLLLAIYPTAWYFDVLLQKSSLDGFLMTVVLCAVAAVLSQPSGLRWALLGAAIAALALTRENALALVPVMLGWLLWLHRDANWPARLRRSAALVAGTAAVLAPVAVRNLAVGGGLYLTTSQLGPNLYIGNNRVANGRYVPLQSGRGSWRFEREDAHRLAEQALGQTLSDREVSRYWVDKTIEFVRAHPGQELVLLLNKLLLALNRTEVGDTDSQYLFADHSRALKLGQSIFHFGVLLPLAGLCLLSWARDKNALLPLLLTCATLLVGMVVFYVFARYRYPLVHPLLLLAALGLGNLTVVCTQRRRHQVALGCSLVVGLGGLANWPLLSPRVVLAESRYNLGVALADAGRANEAAASYQAAIAAHDDFPSAHNNLGSSLAARGDLEGARQQFATALRQEPDHAWASLNLGLVLVRQGETGQALSYLEQAARRLPNSSEAHVELGKVLLSLDRITDALPHLETAVRLEPTLAEARIDLGVAQARSGHLDEALASFQAAVEQVPDDIDARRNLAYTLMVIGRRDQAAFHYREILRRDPGNGEALRAVAILAQAKPAEKARAR